jgi:Flp pilus assembly protein CpaB
VTRRSTSTPSTAFVRQRSLPWRDLRLWAGLLLVIVSTTAGTLLFARDDGSVRVWRAARDLAPGAPIKAEPVLVNLGDAASVYVPVTQALTGQLRVPVAAGALIPASAIGPALPGRRIVTMPVDVSHAPIGLAPGDRVDVWSTPAQEGLGGSSDVPTSAFALGTPVQVLTGVTVVEVAVDELGVGGDVPVALEVEAGDASRLVAASRAGELDLVAVPFDDPVGGPSDVPVDGDIGGRS